MVTLLSKEAKDQKNPNSPYHSYRRKRKANKFSHTLTVYEVNGAGELSPRGLSFLLPRHYRFFHQQKGTHKIHRKVRYGTMAFIMLKVLCGGAAATAPPGTTLRVGMQGRNALELQRSKRTLRAPFTINRVDHFGG